MTASKSILAAILGSALLVACGGGGGGSSGNNGTASTVNIQTYSRDPSIAFGITVNGTNSTTVPIHPCKTPVTRMNAGALG